MPSDCLSHFGCVVDELPELEHAIKWLFLADFKNLWPD
jgi:hypothetical protein